MLTFNWIKIALLLECNFVKQIYCIYKCNKIYFIFKAIFVSWHFIFKAMGVLNSKSITIIFNIGLHLSITIHHCSFSYPAINCIYCFILELFTQNKSIIYNLYNNAVRMNFQVKFKIYVAMLLLIFGPDCY